jgi:NitT/TauT family transport system substrate-binding protein
MRARRLFAIAALIALCASSDAVAQTVREVRIARQPGLSYLPLAVVDDQNLLGKHARAARLGEWRTVNLPIGSAGAISEALLSGSAEMVSGAITPMLVLWDRTRGAQRVRGVTSIFNGVIYLNTINPNVRSLRDFGDQDRIAVSAVGLSVHAIMLRMAAEQTFGRGEHARLDRLTVSMPHPDATAAMLAGGAGAITAHFTAPPFQNIQVRNARVRRLLTSTDILGGMMPGAFVYTTQAFRDANPGVVAAMIAAVEEACAWINADHRRAAQFYLAYERVNMTVDELVELMTNGENIFTAVPENTFKLAEFMHRTGALRAAPASWRDYFFEDLHRLPGS